MNQITSRVAVTDTKEPPTVSGRRSRVCTTRVRSRVPASHPTPSPIAPATKRVPTASCGLRARALGELRQMRGEQGAADQPQSEAHVRRELLRGAAPIARVAGDEEQRDQQEVEEAHAAAMLPQGLGRTGRGDRPPGSRLRIVVTIAHISDPHVGSPYFVPNLMNRVIVELNELAARRRDLHAAT